MATSFSLALRTWALISLLASLSDMINSGVGFGHHGGYAYFDFW